MDIKTRLKENGASVLFVSAILSASTLILSVVALILYAVNCPSEFNGNAVSKNVIGLGISAVVAAFLATAGQIASWFFVKDKKTATCFFWTRLFDYGAFVLSLGGFLFQILDEYSLLGTILYPIVSGTVGDPVDPVLSVSYFVSLVMLLVCFVLSLTAGIMIRKKANASLKTEIVSDKKEVTSNE